MNGTFKEHYERLTLKERGRLDHLNDIRGSLKLPSKNSVSAMKMAEGVGLSLAALTTSPLRSQTRSTADRTFCD